MGTDYVWINSQDMDSCSYPSPTISRDTSLHDSWNYVDSPVDEFVHVSQEEANAEAAMQARITSQVCQGPEDVLERERYIRDTLDEVTQGLERLKAEGTRRHTEGAPSLPRAGTAAGAALDRSTSRLHNIGKKFIQDVNTRKVKFIHDSKIRALSFRFHA